MKKKSRPLTSRENWFLSLVNLPLWRIVFINTRWRDWSRRTPAPLLTKIRMETNTTRKLTSCMSWKLILLWGSRQSTCLSPRERNVNWLSLSYEEIYWMKRDEADDSSCFVVGFSLYPVILALEVFVLVLFFKNLLLILRQSIENFDITGFLNQMIFLKLEEKMFARCLK